MIITLNKEWNSFSLTHGGVTVVSMTAEVHQEAATRVAAIGQRYSEGRRTIVSVLVASDAPVTIPQLLARKKTLAQSSVYRNLAVLEQAGVVQRIVTSDEWARFELAEDLTEHHHHLICSSCGAVADFTLSEDLERSIDSAFARAAKRADFSVDHHRLDLVGECKDCRA
jgi:Fur family ferric uptake transcriptional regulator